MTNDGLELRLKGNWKDMKGKIKEKWGKLTDDDFDRYQRQTRAA